MYNNKTINNSGKINNINMNEKNLYIKKIKQPKRVSSEELEKMKKETMRPLLKDKVWDKITCFGLVVKKYGPYSKRYTVINIIDKSGRFVADHIQLDFKEDIYDYTYDKGDYIKFTGVVKPYERQNIKSSDYMIDIIDKVSIYPSKIYYNGEVIDVNKMNIDLDRISNFLSKSNMTKLYDLLELLRFKLNILTDDLFVNNFIYYYIINQYMLNTAVYNVYDGQIRDQGFNGNIIIDLIKIISSIIFEIRTKDIHCLRDIMLSVCYHCNVIQGVRTYKSIESNPKFIEFCEYKLFNKINKKKINKAWNIVLFRNLNFQDKNPCGDLDNNKILLRAYYIINEFI